MSYHPYHSTIYLDTIQVQMISIKARMDACLDFEMNYHVEWKLLEAQYTALNKEYNRIQEGLQ